MSHIANIVETRYIAHGGQAIATSRQVAGGIGGIGRSVNDATRASEKFNNQWKAIGTTLRYSIAGGVVYGLAGLVGQLKDVQVQLGLISAIGETQGGGLIVGKQLSDLFAQTRAGAVASLTPVSEYNDAVINLLSTIQGVPQDQITPMVTVISRAAKLAQVSAEDATKAFTTMNVAFGRPTNLANVQKMAQEFFILTREAPGGVAAGQQIITQLGQLAQVTRAAHGTPENMFALLLSTLRSGIPPQQAGRGLQFLIQTVAFPENQIKSSRDALHQVGITGNSNLTLNQRLGRIFAHARSLGIKGNTDVLKNLDEETLSDLEAQGGSSAAMSSLGISGRGATYLGTVFRRIHALRTALAIEGQVDVGQAQRDLQTMNDAANGHVSDVNSLSKAWKRFHDQAKLQEAMISLSALGLQVADTFAPVLNLGARGITGITHAAQNHRDAAKVGIVGIASAAALFGVGRFTGLLGKGMRGLSAAEAVHDLSHVGLGASPLSPMYVTIVGDLSLTKAGGFRPPIVPIAKSGIRAVARQAVREGGFGLADTAGIAALAAATTVGPILVASKIWGGKTSRMEHPSQLPINTQQLQNAFRVHPAIRQFFDAMRQPGHGALNPRWANAYQQFLTGNISASQFEKKLTGSVEVVMTIDVNKDGKITRRRVTVPADIWQGGKVPTTRGKKTVR